MPQPNVVSATLLIRWKYANVIRIWQTQTWAILFQWLCSVTNPKRKPKETLEKGYFEKISHNVTSNFCVIYLIKICKVNYQNKHWMVISVTFVLLS